MCFYINTKFTPACRSIRRRVVKIKLSDKKQGISYTINDIAGHTGLSRSTVSRVINQSENVSDKARETVLCAIEEMGYVPNLIARGLRTIPKIIGVVIQDILNPYYIEALYEIEKICKSKGYALLNMNSDKNPAIESDNLYYLLSMKVQGIILLGNMLDETDRMVQLALSDTKLITMEGKIDKVDCVISNPDKSIEAMVDTLLGLGHVHFGLVHHEMRSFPIQERESAFLKHLHSRGYKVENHNFFYGNDYIDQLDKAVVHNHLPTALFALNDNTAFNIYQWSYSRNLKIPEDISVVGFDDVKTYGMMKPSLATIHQPIGNLAEIAANILFERIGNVGSSQSAPKTILINTEFIPRDSIGVPK